MDGWELDDASMRRKLLHGIASNIGDCRSIGRSAIDDESLPPSFEKERMHSGNAVRSTKLDITAVVPTEHDAPLPGLVTHRQEDGSPSREDLYGAIYAGSADVS